MHYELSQPTKRSLLASIVIILIDVFILLHNITTGDINIIELHSIVVNSGCVILMLILYIIYDDHEFFAKYLI